jgi:hypothetical protein
LVVLVVSFLAVSPLLAKDVELVDPSDPSFTITIMDPGNVFPDGKPVPYTKPMFFMSTVGFVRYMWFFTFHEWIPIEKAKRFVAVS